MRIELETLPLEKLKIKPLVRPGSMQLVTREEARRIVNYCADYQIAILGIEAFELLNKTQIMPDMNWILDCSCFFYDKSTFSKKSTDAAKKFMENAPSKLYFELVLNIATAS